MTGTQPSNQGKYAFHFLKGNTLLDGTAAPVDGEWLEYRRPVRICNSGLHASWRVSDALQFAPGTTLCLVEVDQIEDQQNDKLVCRKRKIIARFDATELLRADARASALSVIHLWNAPAIVWEYLETGDESKRKAAARAARAAYTAAYAAYAAARDAAYAAARDAAYAAYAAAYAAAARAARAAYTAAYAAARAAYAVKRKNSERLHEAVMDKFVAMGVLHR